MKVTSTSVKLLEISGPFKPGKMGWLLFESIDL